MSSGTTVDLKFLSEVFCHGPGRAGSELADWELG